MQINVPNLTAEQKKVIEEYAELSMEYKISEIKFATFLAKHPREILAGMLIVVGIIWGLGFICGKLTLSL